jgi:iron(III) transport system substrate-binding protein
MNFLLFTRCLTLSIAVLCSFGSVPAFAQAEPAQAVSAEIALSQGPQRSQRLIDGARKEGALTIYYSARDLAPALEAFSKKYEIQVRGWKSSGERGMTRESGSSKPLWIPTGCPCARAITS